MQQGSCLKLKRKDRSQETQVQIQPSIYILRQKSERKELFVYFREIRAVVTGRTVYINLYKFAVTFLPPSASSLSCEQVFLKAGEMLSKKSNRLSPVEK